MRYFLTVGAWGDSFDGVGHAKRVMRENPGESFGMVHYGFDPDIAIFFREQGLFEDVKNVQPLSKGHYQQLIALCSKSSTPLERWLPEMLTGSAVRPSDVVPVHIHDIDLDRPVERWYGANLPENVRHWADAFLEDIGFEDFYLIQPISLQSTGQDQHWPHWGFAIKWLIDATDENYVLVGQDNIYSNIRKTPNLKNISGYTESMMEVYALADRAKGIITTINSLSMWSVINNIPAVCMSHKYHHKNKYFANWVKCQPNMIVEYEQGIDVFSTLVCSMQN